MSKELTPLEALKEIGKLKEYGMYINTTVEYNIIENALKALLKAIKIIKEKEVNIFIFIHSGDLETYNDMVEDNRKLTQEEHDLLRRVLG